MSGFCERDLHTKVQQQIQARHNGDIQISTEHEKKVSIEIKTSKDVKDGNSTPTCNMTATILHEDHTLGNILRERLMARSDVYTAGYSIPHPLEPKMKFHLQSYGDGPAIMQEELENVSVYFKSLADCIENSVQDSERFKTE